MDEVKKGKTSKEIKNMETEQTNAIGMEKGSSSKNDEEMEDIIEGKTKEDKGKKRALFITSNLRSMEFKMNIYFAKLLTKQYQLHFVILNTNDEKDEKLENKINSENKIFEDFSKNTNLFKNTYEIINFDDKITYFSKRDFIDEHFSKSYRHYSDERKERKPFDNERNETESVNVLWG
uniref:Thioredoxin-like_fold domain-containing protein n=1 Tax=Meloidogyne hapla TaxID=6305 RepID=A0A1I8B7U6_MELHA